MIVSLADYPKTSITTTFSVSLSSAGFECFYNVPVFYKVGDPPLNFAILFRNNTSVTDTPLKQILQPLATDENGSEISLPSFVQYDSTDDSPPKRGGALGNEQNFESMQGRKLFKVDKARYTDVGTYQIGLRLGYE